MSTYCTYFDRGYLARGVVMIDSLLRHDPDASVWVLGLSGGLEDVLAARYGGRVTLVSLPDFERNDGSIANLRAQRSPVEYIFTLTPAWTQFVLTHATSPKEWVTYLDADMWFLSEPGPIYQQMERASVGVVPHRFPRSRRSLTRFGTFNVGWVSFRNDPEGRRCVQWWDERCREWCFDRVEAGRFADQGYLNDFHTVTHQLAVIDHPGVDLAPWNLGRHHVTHRGGRVSADGRPVIFFHFHGISERDGRYYWKNLQYHAITTPAVRAGLFRPYLTELTRVREQLDLPVAAPRGGSPVRLVPGARLALARLSGDSLRVPQNQGASSSGGKCGERRC